jgi:hypothetical protein
MDPTPNLGWHAVHGEYTLTAITSAFRYETPYEIPMGIALKMRKWEAGRLCFIPDEFTAMGSQHGKEYFIFLSS